MKEGESGESYLAIGSEELCSGGRDIGVLQSLFRDYIHRPVHSKCPQRALKDNFASAESESDRHCL